jgi:type I restriction enzyme R subunit
VLALSKAFALASSSDEARAIRDEVGFFQTVRAALVKSAEGADRTAADREFAIQQILDRAVVSTEIVDILAAAGITTPDISTRMDPITTRGGAYCCSPTVLNKATKRGSIRKST